MSAEQRKIIPIIAITRKIIQFISFFLINYAILELIFSTEFNLLTEVLTILPFLQTAQSAWTAGAGLLEYTFFSINRGVFPFLFLGMIGLFGLFSGRIFCGWVCPTGLMQDLFAGLAGENKKFEIETDKSLKKFKMFFLIVFFILFIPLGIYKNTDYAKFFDYSQALGGLVDNPLKYISLSEFLFVTIPHNIQALIEDLSFESIFPNWWQGLLFGIYIIVIGISVYYPRFYCRALCPYAAAISVFSEYSFLKLQRLPTRCPGRKDCGRCEDVCPMQIRILDEEFDGFTGGGECILCLDCMEKCPHDAIKWKFG
jgi:polyferredoxin